MFSLQESTMLHLCALFRRHKSLDDTKTRCPHCSSQLWKERRQPGRRLHQEPRAESYQPTCQVSLPHLRARFSHSNEEMVLTVDMQWKQQVFLSHLQGAGLSIGRSQRTWALLSPITGCWRPPFHRAGRDRGRTGHSGSAWQ